MDSRSLYEEADECRRKAHSYLGKPEASVLVQMAHEFERLALERSSSHRRRGDACGEHRRLG